MCAGPRTERTHSALYAVRSRQKRHGPAVRDTPEPLVRAGRFDTQESRPILTPIPQDNASLEQRLAFRVREYSSSRRDRDSVFALPGLRVWILSQAWPEPPISQQLECLAVLGWWAICSADTAPDREPAIRKEVRRLIAYLDGTSKLRPASVDQLLSERNRSRMYANLRAASEPGSERRRAAGLPLAKID